mgnify:CR=1 FL=1
MSDATSANVTPLVQQLNTRGRTVEVVFACPVSGQQVQARHTLPANRSVGKQVGQRVQRSLMWSVRGALASAIRSALGHGVAGRVASDVAYQMMNEATRTQSSTSMSKGEEQEAVLEAFVSVQSQFMWDPNRSGWVGREAAAEVMSGFEQQLADHPVQHPYDRHIMARMLVEIARADGVISGEEQTWLTDLITADLGSIADLAQRPPLSNPELRNSSQGSVRDSMLLMAWAIALVDEQMDDAELAILRRFARGLELSSPREDRVRKVAQGWILDQALDRMFTWGGHDDHARQQLFQLAGRLGMSQDEALEAEARFQRRKLGR